MAMRLVADRELRVAALGVGVVAVALALWLTEGRP